MQHTALKFDDLSVTHAGDRRREGACSAICFAPFELEERTVRPEPRTGARPVEVISVLLVSPYTADHILIPRILADSNWHCRHCDNCSRAVELLERGRVGVVLCERNQTDGSWRDVLEAAQCQPTPPSVIVCSRLADESLWSEVLHRGGYDVLVKPFDHEEVIRAVKAAWRSWKWASGNHLPHLLPAERNAHHAGDGGIQNVMRPGRVNP
jgi:CheY-like chemotaxis protein